MSTETETDDAIQNEFSGEIRDTQTDAFTISGQEPIETVEDIRTQLIAGGVLTCDPADGITTPSLESMERLYTEALIYLVDDEPELIEIYRGILKPYQKIRLFRDGKEVIDTMFRTGELVEVPHLIISDIGMPIMDGICLFKEILKLDLRVRPGFMALSGTLSDGDRRFFASSGAASFPKPITLDVFSCAVQSLLLKHPHFHVSTAKEDIGHPNNGSQ